MVPLLAAALLAAASPPPDPAPPPPSAARLPRLAPGEVLVEVYGIGFVDTPSTRAVVKPTAQGAGPTAGDARRRLDAAIARILAAARAAGAAPSDVAVRLLDRSNIFDVEAPPGSPTHELVAEVVVRLTNLAAAQPLQDAVVTRDSVYAAPYESPRYELADEAAALGEARRRAIAGARADADAYAAALGMRVARTLRVNERYGPDMMALIFRRRPPSAGTHGGIPQTRSFAVLSVDYVLVPR
ncbi:MAG TPA: SIMPL domain-containing protein [Allosphingosinicella sp.]|jgi:uncharacterized protein YggE